MQEVPASSQGVVTVRYWAAARAAAGTDQDLFPLSSDTTVAAVLDLALARHVDRPRWRQVLGVCSLLVGDRPVGARDRHHVTVRPGDTVEILPPFAGGGT